MSRKLLLFVLSIWVFTISSAFQANAAEPKLTFRLSLVSITGSKMTTKNDSAFVENYVHELGQLDAVAKALRSYESGLKGKINEINTEYRSKNFQDGKFSSVDEILVEVIFEEFKNFRAYEDFYLSFQMSNSKCQGVLTEKIQMQNPKNGSQKKSYEKTVNDEVRKFISQVIAALENCKPKVKPIVWGKDQKKNERNPSAPQSM